MTWHFTVQGKAWTVKTGGLFGWPPRLAVATTLGSTTVFDDAYSPDAQSFAHEFYHVLNTNDFHYLWSWSIGRLWSDSYWKGQERAADAYAITHKDDPDFVAVAAQVRKDLPASSQTATISHPV